MERKFDYLTPNIRFLYRDYKLTSTGDLEKLSYLTFQAKSNSDDHYYEIRAFNPTSIHALSNKDRALTLFLQETLKYYSLAPDAFVLNSLEVQEDKICYALKVSSTPLLDQSNRSSIPKFDFSKLLKDASEDLNHLSLNGLQRVPIPTESIS